MTLPLYGAVFVAALTLCHLRSGRIWRGRHPPVTRNETPVFYWTGIALHAAIAAILFGVGMRNWGQLG